MTLEKFRILHSTIIEHYQFIELHLEGLYAAACGKGFVAGLEDVEKSNIGRLMREIKRLENEKQIHLLSEADHQTLERIYLRRNFWCHNCYVDMVFDRKTQAPKNARILTEDVLEAEQMREKLFQIKIRYLDKIRDEFIF